MENRMNRFALLAASAALAITLTACQADVGDDDDESKPAAEPVALVAPTSSDDAEWKNYLGQVIGNNTDGISERTFNYYLPAGTDSTEEDGPYSRMMNDVRIALQRGVLPGNMLSFSSPNSTMMADLIVEAFEDESIKDTALKGSRVLFVGEAKDESRVRQAALSAGAEFRFVESK
jgi:hypothetical protein